MVSRILSLLLLLPRIATADDVPADCRQVAVYQRTLEEFGVVNDHLKRCRETVTAVHATWNGMRAEKKKAVRGAVTSGSDSQLAALEDTSAVAGAGAETKESWSKIAGGSQASFTAAADSAAEEVKKLDQEKRRFGTLEQVTEPQRERLIRANAAARQDLVKLQASARALAKEASQVSAEFHGDATQLAQVRSRADESAERLRGDEPPETDRRPRKQGVSSNMVVGLAGAAVITAAAIGGLYWVSQKAIKSADDAAAARIAQGQAAANQVIDRAAETATRIIQFAVSSANQVIANAAEAANKIYDRAKTDAAGLLAQLRAEVQAAYPNLTEAGLTKMKGEMQTMFDGLISRAKGEGNTSLVASLTSTRDALVGDITAEISRRHTGSATGTSSSTSTSTGTGSSTATSTASSTATTTVVTPVGGSTDTVIHRY